MSKIYRAFCATLTLVCFILISCAPLFAQGADPTRSLPGQTNIPQQAITQGWLVHAKEAYGGHEQDYWVAAPKFAARDTVQWTYDSYLYFTTSAAAQWEAQVDIPAGGLVTTVECFFKGSATNTGSVYFVKQSYDYNTDTPSNSIITTVASTLGTVYQKPFQDVNETIMYRDGSNRNIYTLVVNMPGDATFGFRGCRLFWNRQISPAPATASFTDVPVTHPFFQNVEALYAARITSGYGGTTLYGPDDFVTRGQMAAFISRALGLHWPY
jgi:hypothetical protein